MQVNESKAEPGRAREHSRAVAARQTRGARQSREGLSQAKQGNAREQGKATQSKGSQQHTHTTASRAQATPLPCGAARAREGVGDERHRLNAQGGSQGLPPRGPGATGELVRGRWPAHAKNSGFRRLKGLFEGPQPLFGLEIVTPPKHEMPPNFPRACFGLLNIDTAQLCFPVGNCLPGPPGNPHLQAIIHWDRGIWGI